MGVTKKMSLPAVSHATAFERFNTCLCVVTFEDPLSAEQQQKLIHAVNQFNNCSPGGKLKPRYSLSFNGTQVTIRQTSLTEAPTRKQFDSLVGELEFNLPGESTSTTTPPPVINNRDKAHAPRRAAR